MKRPKDATPIEHVPSSRTAESFEQKKRALTGQMRSAVGEVRLGKTTSNLVRDRIAHRAVKLDVRAFNNVIAVDTDAGTFDVEGMTSYETLAAATFAHGLLPAVVPQLTANACNENERHDITLPHDAGGAHLRRWIGLELFQHRDSRGGYRQLI